MALVGIVVAVSMMLTGPLSTLLNNATITKYTLSDATVSKANELAKDVQSEAVTLLKNDDSNLPLSGKKVNVFGWGSPSTAAPAPAPCRSSTRPSPCLTA